MKNAISSICIFTLVFSTILSCKTSKIDNELRQKANQLAHENIIVDGHVDLPYRLKIKNFRLERQYLEIPIQSEKGDFDYIRAQKGGLSAPMMSIYIPSLLDNTPKAKLLADSLINLVEFIANGKPQYFTIAKSPAEIESIKKSGKIALPMGMENGSPLQNLEDIAYFKKRGISYVTLTHAKNNQICDSSYDTTKTWNGLSPYGQKAILELAKQGIMTDVSHISDQSFYQVMAQSPVPVIASHSSARAFTPDFQRNMSDEMIKLLGQKNGVIMVNFGSKFLDKKVADERDVYQKKLNQYLKSKNLKEDDILAEKAITEFNKQYPPVYASVETVANHIDHIVKLAGIDHVGFGSDFDGVGDSLPTGLKDVSDYPNLIYVLLKRGYTNQDISKICYQNVFRVWNEVLAYSAKNK